MITLKFYLTRLLNLSTVNCVPEK